MMNFNPCLTPAMHRFLVAIRDSEDGYAIQEGIQIWVGLDRFHAGTVNKCLLLCLISQDAYSDDSTRIWNLNSDGRGVIQDVNYTPSILEHISKTDVINTVMSDTLFEPESISLEQGGSSLTVRQNWPQEKHFNTRHLVEVPCWNEDENLDSCSMYMKVIL